MRLQNEPAGCSSFFRLNGDPMSSFFEEAKTLGIPGAVHGFSSPFAAGIISALGRFCYT